MSSADAAPAPGAERDVAVAAPRPVTGLAAQTAQPGEIFTGPCALAEAAGSGARWIWVLGDGGEPRPDALELLLRPARAHAAAIVAGATVDDAGRLREASVPGFRIESTQLIELVAHRLLPIRHATFVNCLIDAGCFAHHGRPDTQRFGAYAPIEWTARVLRAHEGLYSPSSTVTTGTSPRPPLTAGATLDLARMLRSDAWSRADRLAALRSLVPRRW